MAAFPLSHRAWWLYCLDLSTLLVLAVEQPLLDLISRYPQFLVAQQIDLPQLIGLILCFSLILPAILALLQWWISRIVGGSTWWQAGGVAILAGAFAVLPLKQLLPGPWPVTLFLAGLAGLAAGFGYLRFPPFRMFLTVLAAAILIAPIAFLLNPQVSRALTEPARELADSGVRTSVVMVVFDELPLASLLNRSGNIDPARFPNFSRFAGTSTWFREAHTVHEATKYAVPAILTGSFPEVDVGRVATATNFPNNLISWLQPSHSLNVSESFSRFCTDCGSRRSRSEVLTDLLYVYLQIALPEGLARRSPRINRSWTDFRETRLPGMAFPLRQFNEFLLRINRTSQPSLHFLHVQLPHLPWLYLPSGKRYLGTSDVDDFLINERWVSDAGRVQVAFQRHLLQVALADRLLGRLVETLRHNRLFDDSLIVVASDHGASFRPGSLRRGITERNFEEVLRVPVMIKAPGQRRGEIFEGPFQTIDILPTMAGLLETELAFPVEGRATLSGEAEMAFDDPLSRFDIGRVESTVVCLDGLSSRVTLEGAWAYLDAFQSQGDQVGFFGWAADTASYQPADEILIFSNNRLIHRGPTNYRRPDLVEFFHAPPLADSGYFFLLKRDRFDDQPRVRVLARFGDRFNEVKYSIGFPWREGGVQQQTECLPADCAVAGDPGPGYLINNACSEEFEEVDSFQEHLRELAWTSTPEGIFTYGLEELLDRQIDQVAVEPAGPPVLRLLEPDHFKDVQLDSDFVPAAINGEVLDAVDARFIVAAVNGRIQGFSPLFKGSEGKRRFQVIVPESAFQEGANEVRLLAIGIDSSGAPVILGGR